MEVIYESTKSSCHEKSFIKKLKEKLEEKSKTLVRPSGFMTSTRGKKRVIRDKINSKDSPVVESPSPPSMKRSSGNRRSKSSRRGNKNRNRGTETRNPMHNKTQSGGYRKTHRKKHKKTIKKKIKRKQKKTKHRTKRRTRHRK